MSTTDWRPSLDGATISLSAYVEIVNPSVGWYLASAVNSSTTSIPLANDTVTTPEAPRAGDVLQVRGEDMLVQSWNAGTKTATVVRGYADTDGTAHSAALDGFVNYGARLWRNVDYLLSAVAPFPRLQEPWPDFGISVENEAGFGAAVSTQMYLDNRDGYFNDPTVYGSWHYRPVRFYASAPTYDRGGEGVSGEKAVTWTYGTLAIDDINMREDLAVFSLISLDGLLRSRNSGDTASAEDVKEKNWYTIKDSRFLIGRLLSGRYGFAREDVPRHWLENFPSNMELPTYQSLPLFSEYGRPPEWDGQKWIETTTVATAVLYDQASETLYYGSAGELWKRDLSTGIDSRLDVGYSDSRIVRIWKHTSGALYYVILKNLLQTGPGTQLCHPSQWMFVRKYEGSTASTIKIVDYCSTGYSHAERLLYVNDAPGYKMGRPYGEGLLAPFPQYIMPEPAEPWNNDHMSIRHHVQEANAILLGAPGVSTKEWWDSPWSPEPIGEVVADDGFKVQRGYHGIAIMKGQEERDQLYFGTSGQRGAFAYDPAGGTRGTMYYWTFTRATTNQFGLYSLNMATGATTLLASYQNEQPTAMFYTSGLLYYATFESTNSSVTTPCNTRLRRMDTGTLAVTSMFDSSGLSALHAQKYAIILELGFHGLTAGTVLASIVLRNQFYLSNQPYRIGKMDALASATTFTFINGPGGSSEFSTQPVGWTRSQTAVYADHETWCILEGGFLARYSPSGEMVLVEQVDTLVRGEPYSTGALSVWVDDSGEIGFRVFGVSSPLPSFYTERAATNTLGPGFGKYHLWKVDSRLADRFLLGDFNDLDRGAAIELLANARRSVPYFDNRGDFRLRLLPDLATASPSMILSDDGTQDPSAWSNFIFWPWMDRPNMSPGLREVYNTATAVPYNASQGEAEAPVLKLSEASLFREENWLPADLETWKATHGDLKLPSLSVSAFSEAPLRIVMRCTRGGKLLHSTAGQRPTFVRELDLPTITMALLRQASLGASTLYVDRIPINDNLSAQFEASADQDRGDLLSIGSVEYWDASHRKISGYDLAASSITISPAVMEATDPEAPYPPGTILRVTSRSSAIPDVTSYAFTSGVGVEVYPGITVALTATSASVDDEIPLSEGDRIIIELPGATLVKQKQSGFTITDVSSIKAGNAKRAYPMPDNRFYGPGQAHDMTLRKVAEYRFPHYLLHGGSVRLLPAIEPLQVIAIHSPRLFPNSTNQMENFYVRGYSHRGLARTELSLRGTRELAP